MPRLNGAVKGVLRRQALQGRRKTLHKMQKGACRYCRTKLSWEGGTVDHRIPRSKGGSDQIENLVFACRPCNLEKRSMTEEEYLALRRERERATAAEED